MFCSFYVDHWHTVIYQSIQAHVFSLLTSVSYDSWRYHRYYFYLFHSNNFTKLFLIKIMVQIVSNNCSQYVFRIIIVGWIYLPPDKKETEIHTSCNQAVLSSFLPFCRMSKQTHQGHHFLFCTQQSRLLCAKRKWCPWYICFHYQTYMLS